MALRGTGFGKHLGNGPVALSCRPKCAFKPPFVRMRQGFSIPVLSVCGADCRSRLCVQRSAFQLACVFPMPVARTVLLCTARQGIAQQCPKSDGFEKGTDGSSIIAIALSAHRRFEAVLNVRIFVGLFLSSTPPKTGCCDDRLNPPCPPRSV